MLHSVLKCSLHLDVGDLQKEPIYSGLMQEDYVEACRSLGLREVSSLAFRDTSNFDRNTMLYHSLLVSSFIYPISSQLSCRLALSCL